MAHRFHSGVVGCVCLLAACLGGCNPAPTAAEGKVTLDGQPLDEAVIMFVPLEAGRKKTGGSVQAGSYQVEASHGLFPGRYRVEVIDDPPMELALRIATGKAPEAIRRRRIPQRYAHDSPLSIEVVSGAKENFDFELTSAGP